jgi:AcrR family transcriptional regulator
VTRARILETALRLFRDRGYDETTMRAIADQAGVSLGNAYYYFRSKEELIQAFYARTHEEHLAACEPVLEREADLEARLLGVMRAKLDTIEPYHRFAGLLFRTAADPRSPLNPFSDLSAPVRADATALFARVVEGSTAKVKGELGRRLPNLLWIYHMGIILHWIHDPTPERVRTRRLVERSVDLIVVLVRIARTPLARPLLERAFALLDALDSTLDDDRGRER